jgi:hypothetical protein
MATKKKAPWDRPPPKKAGKKKSTSLSSAQKKHAAARAKKAGRSYPNLVDNMAEARGGSGARKKATRAKPAGKKKTAARRKTAARKVASKRGAGTKSSAKKAAPKKKAARKKASAARSQQVTRKSVAQSPRKRPASHAVTKDPRGGLTAAGRKAFKERDGSHLRPGVTKRVSEMSREDMKRKGSWAVRFFGREQLPPLQNDKGEPTRFALTAAAWGEPVPKTIAAARKIAAKGQRLLERAKRA